MKHNTKPQTRQVKRDMTQSSQIPEPAAMKDRIRNIRKKNHLSQVELAKKLGVSQSVISLIESGHASVSIEILKRVSEQFDVSCDWLIYGKDKYTRLSVKNSFVPFISAEAEAGYISNHQDPEYTSSLNLYKLPDFENGEFRIFMADSDSMVPSIHPHDKVICEKLDKPEMLVEGTINVLVTKNNIVMKRIYFWEQDRNYIVLKSDNRHYTEERIPKTSVLEMWAVRAKLTTSFVDESSAQNERMDSLERDLTSIKDQVAQLLRKPESETEAPPALLDALDDPESKTTTVKASTTKLSGKKNQ